MFRSRLRRETNGRHRLGHSVPWMENSQMSKYLAKYVTPPGTASSCTMSRARRPDSIAQRDCGPSPNLDAEEQETVWADAAISGLQCLSADKIAFIAERNRNSLKCCEWLIQIGHEPRLFPDHDTCLEWISSVSASWLLVMIDIDSTGGPDFAETQIHALQEALPGIPVILFGKCGNNEGLDRKIAQDVCQVLAKPFSRATLFAALRNALMKSPRQGSIPHPPRSASSVRD